MVSDIDSSAYSGGSNPPIVVNAPPPPTTAHAASESTGTGSGRCASLFQANPPPKPPTPYTRPKNAPPPPPAARAACATGSPAAWRGGRIRCSRAPAASLLFGSAATRTAGIEPAPSRHEPSASTAGVAHTTAKKSTMHAYQHSDTPRCAPQSDSEIRRIH